MKRTICALAAFGTVLGALGPGTAMAVNCVAGGGYAQLNQTQVEALVGTSMACYPAAGPPWTNQEYHGGSVTSASGTITDYKKGPGDPRDPTKQIGSYSIDGTGAITYTYGGAPTYTYTVWGNTTSGSGIYDFCNALLVPLAGQVYIAAQTLSPQACTTH